MHLSLLAILPLLVACSSAPTTESNPATTVPTTTAPATAPTADTLPPPDTARTAAVSTKSDTLRVKRIGHEFSRPGVEDVFRLVLRGPSVLESRAEFTITDVEGKVIFRETLTEPDLEAALVYELKTPSATPAQREAYVLRRVEEFFQPANFKRPAVAPNAPFPKGIEGLDRDTWEELSHFPKTVRFQYLVGKEDRRAIAWAPMKQQVIRLQ